MNKLWLALVFIIFLCINAEAMFPGLNSKKQWFVVLLYELVYVCLIFSRSDPYRKNLEIYGSNLLDSPNDKLPVKSESRLDYPN